ncbi:MAG: hypothetical protein KUG77_00995, partial [Nannocystaceae bacterium]|nr:hypothetical protein [Nannocystaceae bacterium]
MSSRFAALALLAICTCAHDEQPPLRQARATAQPLGAATMEHHFEEADALRRAAFRGELDTVREVATGFGARVAGSTYPQLWGPPVERLERVLGVAARVSDVRESASVVAEVGAACGACHREH